MQLKVFAMRDIKADAYGSPFFLPNDALARRMLSEWVLDKRSEVAKYPAEFHLFELGTFDNESGLLTACTPQFICAASSCLPRPDPRQTLIPGLEPAAETVTQEPA